MRTMKLRSKRIIATLSIVLLAMFIWAMAVVSKKEISEGKSIACYSNMYFICDELRRFYRQHKKYPEKLSVLENFLLEDGASQIELKDFRRLFACPHGTEKIEIISDGTANIDEWTDYVYLGQNPVSINLNDSTRRIILFCPIALKERKVFIGIEIEGAGGVAHPLRGPIDDEASLKLLNSLASRRKHPPE